jgi:hypothetical protein
VEWETQVALQGEVKIQRFFHSAAPRAIRTGIYGFVSNTPGADLQDFVATRGGLPSSSTFRLPRSRSHAQVAMKKARLPVEKATTKGWLNTPLADSVDMIVLGSVARDDKGYLVGIRHGAAQDGRHRCRAAPKSPPSLPKKTVTGSTWGRPVDGKGTELTRPQTRRAVTGTAHRDPQGQ